MSYGKNEFKINERKCKALTFRKDLCTEEAISYFTAKDRFFVDKSKTYYDFKNKPMYKASTRIGKEGFVYTEGVEEIARRNNPLSRVYLANHKKT